MKGWRKSNGEVGNNGKKKIYRWKRKVRESVTVRLE